MNNLPKYKDYKLISQLGSNHWGGRKTYLAEKIKTSTRDKVVIKTFQFATPGSTWSDLKHIEREVHTLKRLHNAAIPQYIESFQSNNCYTIVMEYIEGVTLEHLQFTLAEIHHLAISILEILVYLQSQFPPIIHRDIKPQNIVHSTDDKFYLIDFGLSALADNQLRSSSSIIAGTPGFIAPEQLIHGKVNPNSDLYALGLTLFCLLANLKSEEVTQYIDHTFKLNINPVKHKISGDWFNWLNSIVQSDSKNRPKDAQIALTKLKQLSIFKQDKIRFEFDCKKSKVIFKVRAIIITFLIFVVFFVIVNFISWSELNRLSELDFKNIFGKFIKFVSVLSFSSSILVAMFGVLTFRDELFKISTMIFFIALFCTFFIQLLDFF